MRLSHSVAPAAANYKGREVINPEEEKEIKHGPWRATRPASSNMAFQRRIIRFMEPTQTAFVFPGQAHRWHGTTELAQALSSCTPGLRPG